MPKLLAAAARSIQKLGCIGLEAVDDAEPRQRLADEHIIVEPRHFGITSAGQFEARGATRDTIARNMMLGEPVGNLLRLREHMRRRLAYRHQRVAGPVQRHGMIGQIDAARRAVLAGIKSAQLVAQLLGRDVGGVEVVKSIAARQAAVTHDTPDGIAAAQAAAVMVHYLLYRLGPRRDPP
jgi:hypothetical protein